MNICKLNVTATLKHILDQEPKPLINDDSKLNVTEPLEPQNEIARKRSESVSRLENETSASQRASLRRSLKDPHRLIGTRDSFLDLSGPPLMSGFYVNLRLHVLMSHINWPNKPLYFSLIFKCMILGFMVNRIFSRVMDKIVDLIDERDLKNPIFVFIGFLAIITTVVQFVTNSYVSTFNLGTFYKILREPKLCFIRQDILDQLGNKMTSFMVMFLIYNGILTGMLVSDNFNHFIETFDLVTLIIDIYMFGAAFYCLCGDSLIDFYIRTSFGHWVIALRDHLEKQFAYLHRQHHVTPAKTRSPIKMITLDEIQRSLNNMDDHLEVMRSVHSFSLVLMSLNSFLGNGGLILMTYHLISDQKNYYHGFIVFLLSTSYFGAVFLCYFGDSWLYHALGSLVQCIEDEYFLQSDIKTITTTTSTRIESTTATETTTQQREQEQQIMTDQVGPFSEIEPLTEQCHEQALATIDRRKTHILKKKHVLFFREFLHQFENHLATPWTNLTFVSHLHILRAFVTLVAAQIIFDHEH